MEKRIKKLGKKIISKKFHANIGKKYRNFLAKLHHRNLTQLAIIFNSDKWGKHSYTIHYQEHFAKIKNKKLNILEVGIGGYDDPNMGGSSLRMWKAYFPKSNIFGIDLYDKKGVNENRITCHTGSQNDEDFLNTTVNSIGEIDIVIDDGSHINSDIIKTFKFLFPKLKTNGIYVVEDLQTSYWPQFGGSTTQMEIANTAVNFFKSLIHGINHVEFIDKDYNITYYDKNIISIHFYHNLIFIYKGVNSETSNILVKNQMPY